MDDLREERDELEALAREDAEAERREREDAGLEYAELVTLETARWSR
jgi:hypothetical protein